MSESGSRRIFREGSASPVRPKIGLALKLSGSGRIIILSNDKEYRTRQCYLSPRFKSI